MLLFFLFCFGFGARYINTVVFDYRPVYISKTITNSDHLEAIKNAMGNFGIIETQNKSQNHIRIQYERLNGGGIWMTAHSHTDGYFYVTETVIGINRLVDRNTFQCLVLHEFGHSFGLGHSERGIMRASLQPQNQFCNLEIEDLIALYDIGFFNSHNHQTDWR